MADSLGVCMQQQVWPAVLGPHGTGQMLVLSGPPLIFPNQLRLHGHTFGSLAAKSL